MLKAWVMSIVGMMFCTFVSQAYAANTVATSVFGPEVSGLGLAVQALIIIVAAVVVGAIAINAVLDLRRGDIGTGVLGIFGAILAGLVLFTIIPLLINRSGAVAAAATLR